MHCATCNAELSGAYCAFCGEKRFDPHSLSLGHFFEHAFEAFAHFDGTVFRTLRMLVLHPGKLTAEYVRGARKPYLAPVQFFLLMNVLYFAATTINGWNTLNTDLNTHRTWSSHQQTARVMVDRRLAERNISLADYRLVFDTKSAIQAKSLVIVMVPAFALALAALRFAERRYFTEHLVFSLHFYAFFLLFLSVSTTITTLVLLSLKRWAGIVPGGMAVDQWVSMLSLAVLWPYLSLAVRATGIRSWGWAIGLGAALFYVVYKILQGYRFLLFLVAYYTV